MGKKKEKENLTEELAKSFGEWEYLNEHGGSDPFYADGTNMNLVRNHIMYYKNKMVEEYGADYEKYPEIFYRELPPEVNQDYMARAGEIKDGAAQALEYYISDPNFHYLLLNKDMLTEKEAKQISLYNVLGYASGLARAIKDGDLITMRRHANRPEGYLESFAQCATRMMKIIDEKKKEPEQVQENGQLSLFQFGMEMGQCR
ncbi:MAG: hypothetical protein K2N82_09170 [Lachnospiraceae bacterium]|nr:hypothetical protein [Lachnospiraceae bacterium]